MKRGYETMTYCEKLSEKKNGSKTITAWKNIDKFSNRYRYEITISDANGFAYITFKTSKSGWKSAFNSIN